MIPHQTCHASSAHLVGSHSQSDWIRLLQLLEDLMKVYPYMARFEISKNCSNKSSDSWKDLSLKRKKHDVAISVT